MRRRLNSGTDIQSRSHQGVLKDLGGLQVV